MLGRITTIFAIILGITAYLAPELVLCELARGFGALLSLPFEVIPLGTILNTLIVSPPSLAFLALFLLGSLLLGLVELG